MSEGAQETVELRLLGALQQTPGLTIVELNRIVGCCRTITGDHLRRLAWDGTLEKDPSGHWRYATAAELEATPAPKPRELRAAEHAPWVKSILSYERRETTIVEGLRYG
jgi:hypothetical protein